MIWRAKHRSIEFADRARVMGILNVTPDSFSDGGRHLQLRAALDRAREMIREGAEIIDIGGESTRPGAPAVDAAEEIRRTLPVVTALRKEWSGWISIDTSKAAVAMAGLDAGADVVNDITGLRRDPDMIRICRESGCGIIVMHMQGTPQTMQKSPHYDDVRAEVSAFFSERMRTLQTCGIPPESIVFDPGIGFGKSLEHNLTLLRSLDSLETCGRPIMLGASRKSFIAGILENPNPAMRDWPTVAVTAFARERGTLLHRVHAVKPNLEAIRMMEAIMAMDR